VLGFSFLVLIVVRNDHSRVLYLLRAVAASGSLVAIYGTLQFFGWDPWLPAAQYHIGDPPWTIVRPPSTLGYVSYFASYLLTVMFAGAGLALLGGSVRWRVFGGFVAVLSAFAVVLSGTRAAVLGMAAGAAVFLLLLRPRWSGKRLIAIPALAVALFACFYFSDAGQKLRSRTRWYVEDPAGGPRLWLWRDSIRMAANRPVAGFGIETYSRHFPRFESRELARLYPDFRYESPHNVFIDTLAGQGIGGLVIFGALAFGGLLTAWRVRRSSRLAAVLAGALSASLVAHQFSCFTVPTALFFFVTISLIAALEEQPAYSLNRAVVPIVLVLSAGLMFFSGSLVVADRSLYKARALFERGQPEEAAKAYSAAMDAMPPGVSADLWYSRTAARTGLGEEALRAARRATTTSEDYQDAWYNLAVLAGLSGDPIWVESSLRSAIAAAPNWYKPHWILARFLQQAGRLEEARREADLAIDLNAGKNPVVRETLAALR
jgi:O-antigen ligase